MQRSQRLLKTYEPEVSEAMTKALTTQGIHLLTGASFERVEQDGNVKKIYIEVDGKKQVIEADELLIATGRTPNTAALRLEAAGVKTGSRGEIIVNDYLQTTNPRIYAAGDVTLYHNLFMSPHTKERLPQQTPLVPKIKKLSLTPSQRLHLVLRRSQRLD